MTRDPHAGQPVLHRGARLGDARLAMILLHGRGSSAEDMMGLAEAVFEPDIAYLAPQAADHTWYPYSFLSPLAQNEPYLTSALGAIGTLIDSISRQGVQTERVVLLGFSQGACLSLEFAARQPRRYAAVVGLSGGLIGPDGTDRAYPGSLDGTPVFLGCSDRDPHVPVARVHESAAVLRRLGASVDERIYPGMGHTVNDEELDVVRTLIGSPSPSRA
jgi:phospholipase/carboxylesterase